MRKILCAVMLVCVMASGAWAAVNIVEINKDNFPDDLFRYYIQADCDKPDEYGNKDGWLSDEEIAAVDIFNKPGFTGNKGTIRMESMKGVEYLTELVSIDCRNNPLLTELDVSRNKKLRYLNCKDCSITSLNVSGLTELVYLNCDTNALTRLDVTGCTNLEELSCCINTLEELDLSGNMKLKRLACWANDLRTLDVSNHIYLTTFDCNMNNIVSLNASGCTSLNHIHSPNNLLTSINVDGCTNLWTIDVQGNRLRGLDVSGHSELYDLKCNTNLLVSLDVSGCGKLWNLDCHDNRLVNVNLQGCAGLKTVNFSNNQLEEIDVSQLVNLVMLYANSNRLSGLDVSRNYSLQHLRCGNNNITEINLSGNRNLYDLEIQNNSLAELDLSGNIFLSSDNAPKSLSVSTPYGVVTVNFLNMHVITGPQIISGLDIVRHDGNEYPFTMDFSGYMSSSGMGNVIASSVQGFDESGAEVETTYSGGTASFGLSPLRVRYSYSTGHSGVNMDVIIGEEDFVSLALNGHVYRAYNRAVSWEEAKSFCDSLGGHLAVLASNDVKSLARELIRMSKLAGDSSSGGYWLGGGRDSNEVWHWDDGSDFTDEIAEDDVHDVYNISIIRSTAGGQSELIRRVKRKLPEEVYLQITEDGKFEGWHELYPSGFICEWEPVSVDTAPYSDEYLRYISGDQSESAVFGYVPSPVDYALLNSNLPQAHYDYTLPKYDPREPGNDHRSLRVGDQSPYGTCWAFAAIGAMEASYVAQGFGSEAPDLSELHLAWYTYKDSRQGYSRELDSQKYVLSQGGTSEKAITFLSRIGTASEADLPYEGVRGTEGKSVEETDKNVADYVASKIPANVIYPEDFRHPLRLKAAYNLTYNTALRSNRAYESDLRSQSDRIKHLIMDYGAVRIGYKHFSRYEKGINYYAPDVLNQEMTPNDGGHAVILVGWDDNYSSDNFKTRSIVDGTTKPSANGAWLAKNSWGDDWPKASNGDGYFWISYEQEMHDCSVFVADDSAVSNTPYAHDTAAATEPIKDHWSANIFKAENTESLNEVSFSTAAPDMHYEVYVNKLGMTFPNYGPGVPQGSPVKTGTLDYVGYHTVELDNPIDVRSGEYFAVMVKLSSSKAYSGYLTMAAKDNSYIVNLSAYKAGRSWFARAETITEATDWKNGSSYKTTNGEVSLTASIKAFPVARKATQISPSIITASLPSGAVGTQYSQFLATIGTRPITWTVTGLPDGLTQSSGRISGTPTTPGTYTVSISASNSKATVSKNLQLVIDGDPIDPTPTPPTPGTLTITTASLPSGTAGASYSATLACNAASAIWSVASGNLPAGLTLNPITGRISGTPGSTGTSAFTIRVVSGARSATKEFNITVSSYDGPTPSATAPTITITSLASGTVGTQYSQTLTANGSTPITWTVTGLPGGLTHSSGTISGTPTAAGRYSVTVTARNSAGVDSETLTLVITAPPAEDLSITTASLPSGTVGASYLATLAANLSGATWSVSSGTLPAGLSLSSSGTISGTPTSAGRSTFTVKASSGTRSATKQLTITISEPPEPDPEPEPDPDTDINSSNSTCSSSTPFSAMSALLFFALLRRR